MTCSMFDFDSYILISADYCGSFVPFFSVIVLHSVSVLTIGNRYNS